MHCPRPLARSATKARAGLAITNGRDLPRAISEGLDGSCDVDNGACRGQSLVRWQETDQDGGKQPLTFGVSMG